MKDPEIENMLNPQGKLCANCHWSGFRLKQDDFVTCGIYGHNFSVNSFCDQWKKQKQKNPIDGL